MLLPHNKVSGGVQDSQIMIPSFFDRFYVMPLVRFTDFFKKNAKKKLLMPLDKLRDMVYN